MPPYVPSICVPAKEVWNSYDLSGMSVLRGNEGDEIGSSMD